MHRRSHLGEASPVQTPYYEEPGYNVADVTLSGNGSRSNLAVFFDRDAEFYITGLVGSSTGAYKVQIQLPDGRHLSPSQIKNSNIVGTAQFPVPMYPAIRVPAGGQISLNLTDLSGSENVIQLVFVGIRRYNTR